MHGLVLPLRDVQFGSVLFRSAIPILPPAVGFPASYTFLVKQAPEGIHGYMERGGTVGGGGWGFPCASERCHLPPPFRPLSIKI